MKPKRLRPAFRDSRGAITDILDDVPLNSVTIITSRKGVVRGNHYHRKTVQYTYMLKGRIRYVSRRGKGKPRSFVMRAGDITSSPPMEAHAILALEDSEFIVLSMGPRHGKDYERDTFRLDTPMVEPLRNRRRK